MSKSQMAIEYSQAAKGMSASACHTVLSSLRSMANDPGAAAALQRIHNLTTNIRRAADHLDAGEQAYKQDNAQTAGDEWSKAISLMDTVSQAKK